MSGWFSAGLSDGLVKLSSGCINRGLGHVGVTEVLPMFFKMFYQRQEPYSGHPEDSAASNETRPNQIELSLSFKISQLVSTYLIMIIIPKLNGYVILSILLLNVALKFHPGKTLCL